MNTSQRRLALIGAAVVAIVGSLGPWVSALGFISVAGTDGDGIITLWVAALAAAAFLSPRGQRTIGLLAGVSLTGVAMISVVRVMSDPLLSAGWGLWLVVLAGVGMMLLAAVGPRANRTPAVAPSPIPPPPTMTYLPPKVPTPRR